ncbi:MAG: hypothetical protein IKA59_03645 [Clostridia bacterium]|nr:hypothetical protein [Clostridia bacterium]
MEQTEKIEAIVTENQFVENRVQEKKRFSFKSLKAKGIDLLDLAIVPVTLGVFISLGFLFAGLFGLSSTENITSIFDMMI